MERGGDGVAIKTQVYKIYGTVQQNPLSLLFLCLLCRPVFRRDIGRGCQRITKRVLAFLPGFAKKKTKQKTNVSPG